MTCVLRFLVPDCAAPAGGTGALDGKRRRDSCAHTMTGMRRLGEAALGLALLLGVFQSGSCLRFEVKDSSNKTCILADLSVNFTVEYKIGDKQFKGNFPLPTSAVVDKNSSCAVNKTAVSLLIISFAPGHSLSINFTKSDAKYQVDQLLFTYNLSDTALFPNATENGTRQVSSGNTEIFAKTNEFYQCNSQRLITMGSVNATLQNVKLEAYLNGNGYSANGTVCKEDVTPTAAPTVAPSPTPLPPTPDTGNYSVNDSSKKACILARMGLQLNITYLKKGQKENTSLVFNVDPKKVLDDGSCSNNISTLRLSSVDVLLLFTFTMNTTESKFYLSHVHANKTILDAEEPNFIVDSGNLSLLPTTAHKSYKCNTKQTLKISDRLSIDTYKLQIQAFEIDENKFGPALDCADDKNGMLVPIVVGAALAGLVLIVLVAYLIGRKRSHAGYQTI